jgi:hypothetical protein
MGWDETIAVVVEGEVNALRTARRLVDSEDGGAAAAIFTSNAIEAEYFRHHDTTGLLWSSLTVPGRSHASRCPFPVSWYLSSQTPRRGREEDMKKA